MALSTYPAVASPIKSIQRGSAGGAGSVTITSIVPLKSTINVFGSASSGTVSASFGMSMNAGSLTLLSASIGGSPNVYGQHWAPSSRTGTVAGSATGGGYGGLGWNQNATVNAGTAVVNAGSNNLVSAVVTGYIQDATTIVVSGACRWEVVEYN
jgi:hypothetical protein